jgi:hypothetical protein
MDQGFVRLEPFFLLPLLAHFRQDDAHPVALVAVAIVTRLPNAVLRGWPYGRHPATPRSPAKYNSALLSVVLTRITLKEGSESRPKWATLRQGETPPCLLVKNGKIRPALR